MTYANQDNVVFRGNTTSWGRARTIAALSCSGNKSKSRTGQRESETPKYNKSIRASKLTNTLEYNLNNIYSSIVVVTNSQLYLGCTSS